MTYRDKEASARVEVVRDVKTLFIERSRFRLISPFYIVRAVDIFGNEKLFEVYLFSAQNVRVSLFEYDYYKGLFRIEFKEPVTVEYHEKADITALIIKGR